MQSITRYRYNARIISDNIQFNRGIIQKFGRFLPKQVEHYLLGCNDTVASVLLCIYAVAIGMII